MVIHLKNWVRLGSLVLGRVVLVSLRLTRTEVVVAGIVVVVLLRHGLFLRFLIMTI
jgi:hypothetical protein